MSRAGDHAYHALPLQSALGMDWNEPQSGSSTHFQLVVNVDWGSTPLGLPSTWPSQLHHMIDLIMADPTPAAIMWGDDLTMIYNEAFVDLVGSKHPALMGGTPIVEYAEVWDTMFAGIIADGRQNRKTTRHKDVRMFLNRHGFTEECYVTYTFIPILGPGKTVVGFYHTVMETTDQVLSDRRTKTLLAIGDNATSATGLAQYWDGVIHAFESNKEDVPFVVAYSFRGQNDTGSVSTGSDSGSSSSTGVRLPLSCTLAGTLGRSIGQIPLSFNVRDEDDVFVQAVRESIRSGAMKHLNQSMDMPEWLFQDQPATVFNEPCTSAMIVPIRPTTTNDPEGRNIVGFLVCGLNPRRRYDEGFAKFGRLWSIQLATSAASVVLFEQEMHRQKQLTQQLLVSRKAAQDTEVRFSRFAELSNVAMWISDSSGRPLYNNKAWREQTLGAVEHPESASWTEIVSEKSKATFEDNWALLLNEKIPVSFECQLKSSRNDSEQPVNLSTRSNKWILCAAFPDLAEDGSVKAIWGCNTDISHQKWTEILKEQRLLDLLEAKRQTENFIDMTSHEMRNPLSAILQCADGINDIMKEIIENDISTVTSTTAESISESAQTIALCAQHQKRIVDDILTLSKLDASLLVVTPAVVDPIALARRALKLHQQELQAATITSRLQVEDSYDELTVQRVFLDPSRILQILMNLITNAIKFTQDQPGRSILLSLGASAESPGEGDNSTEYFPPKEQPSIAQPGDEGRSLEDVVFLKFSVQDTGCGLTDAEMQKLFLRFSQASPKTHVQYGGSGLGLFICKELTELQGGRIGVSSTPGQGSDFKFYVKARRAGTAQQTAEQDQDKHEKSAERASKKLKLLEDMNLDEKIEPLSPMLIDGSTSDPDKLHILIVEDNLINQRVMASQLRKANCVVHTANHGADALGFLQRSTFAKDCGPNAVPLSILLLDLEMPVMDGLTCVAEIRRREASLDFTQRVPVIAITANARLEQVEKAMAHGMDDVITKPFKISELVPKMRSLIEKMTE